MNTGEKGRVRVLVAGCGGIGGVAAGLLSEAGLAEVVSYSTNADIAAAVNGRGYQLTGAEAPRAVPGRCVTALDPAEGLYDYVLLAVQPPQVEAAARQVASVLAPDGAAVCLQNGLCEARIAPILGPERVLGAVVGWGATMPAPGVYERTAKNGFVLGRLDQKPDPRLERLATLLGCIGPTQVSPNFAGARWSKLAINCAISTLGTLGGERLGSLMVSIRVRRLALRIMSETVRVAHAEGVALEKVSGTLDLDWIALTEREERAVASPGLFAKHAMLLAVGARYRRMKSSMLSAIERGRPAAVDYLNGEVVSRGAGHHIATPVNAAAQAMVHAVARGERRSSMATIYDLAAQVGVG
ncbi:MAG: 2-dehydropantoate 2-reductase [Myxococcales bacterium]|nr:2-dehydropantoate 2-reductase [Myxococcales bacterium]